MHLCQEASNTHSEEQQHDSSLDSIHTHPAYAALNNQKVSNLQLSASGDFCGNGHFVPHVKQCLLCQNEPSLVSDKQQDTQSALPSWSNNSFQFIIRSVFQIKSESKWEIRSSMKMYKHYTNAVVSLIAVTCLVSCTFKHHIYSH